MKPAHALSEILLLARQTAPRPVVRRDPLAFAGSIGPAHLRAALLFSRR